MTTYLYGAKSRAWDAVQHLRPVDSMVSLCGIEFQWVSNNNASTPLPGLVLCEDCQAERVERQKREVRYAWVRPQEAR